MKALRKTCQFLLPILAGAEFACLLDVALDLKKLALVVAVPFLACAAVCLTREKETAR